MKEDLGDILIPGDAHWEMWQLRGAQKQMKNWLIGLLPVG